MTRKSGKVGEFHKGLRLRAFYLSRQITPGPLTVRWMKKIK